MALHRSRRRRALLRTGVRWNTSAERGGSDTAGCARNNGGALDSGPRGVDFELRRVVAGVRVRGRDLDGIVAAASELLGGNPDESSTVGEVLCAR